MCLNQKSWDDPAVGKGLTRAKGGSNANQKMETRKNFQLKVNGAINSRLCEC